jgi:hypothetical protein
MGCRSLLLASNHRDSEWPYVSKVDTILQIKPEVLTLTDESEKYISNEVAHENAQRHRQLSLSRYDG